MWNDAYAFDQLVMISKDVTLANALTKVYGLRLCQSKIYGSQTLAKLFCGFIIYGYAWFSVISRYVLLEYNDIFQKKVHTQKLILNNELMISVYQYCYICKHYFEQTGITFQKDYQCKCRGSACLGKYSCVNIVKKCFGMMYYEPVLRILDDFERINENTTDDVIGEKLGYIVSCQVY